MLTKMTKALDMVDNLPDLIHVPFEQAVADVRLTGWEDQWFSQATYDVSKWGKLEEPKIDFVYLCRSARTERRRRAN
jgi:hypothetical protein